MPYGKLHETLGPQRTLISRFLDTNGDGTGTENFIGSHLATTAYIQPATTEIIRLTRLIVSIEDGTGIKSGLYGGLSALTNGITITQTDDSGTLVDFTDGVPIKTNAQWGQLCYDVSWHAWSASPTEEMVLVRYTFSRMGQDVRLNGANAAKLQVNLNDNFTGLLSHRFLVQGYYEFPVARS
jgi:hypothetical protein